MSSIRITLNKRTYVVFVAAFLGLVLVLPAITPTFNFLNVFNISSDWTQSAFAAKDKDDDEGKKEGKFHLEEVTIAGIHNAIKTKQITCTELVQAYIDRAAAYNGVCTKLVTADGAPIPAATGYVRAGSSIVFPTDTVPASSILPNLNQYIGLPLDFGRMEPTASDPSVKQQFGMVASIPDAGQLSALSTLNIRGERSVTCQGAYDAHPSTGPLPAGAPPGCEAFRQQPDALERAAELDKKYRNNPPLDKLPMYCIPFSFKDSFDTKDMRSTAGGDVNYAMDAPPKDGTIAAELRAKGAIIYAKANSAEYNAGGGDPGGAATAEKRFLGAGRHSTWGGIGCNSYDTERDAGGSSSGSGISVAANLAVISICEETNLSCRDPASKNGLVSLRTSKDIISYGGAVGVDPYFDIGGIHARTVKDAALVLDALKDPERGYFDPRHMYTAVPKALISEEPYASFVIDEKDLKGKPLAGMRIGIVREFMLKPTLNDVAMSDQINNEIKTILRDKLGAELVESFDPLYPDDPTIPNMEYTFQDGLAEILPLHIPEYFSKTVAGALEFAVPGYDVTKRDYMVKVSRGEAPLSDNLNLRRISSFPGTFSFSLHLAQYLAERGDESVYDWASLNDNSKFFSDARRAAHDNWENKVDIRSDGMTDRMKMREVMRLVLNNVMYENNLDVMVNPVHTTPVPKIGGPNDPGSNQRVTGCISCPLGIPEIVVPAGFNQIVYEPQFALNTAKNNYIGVTGTVQSLLPNPMPIGISFWAGPGEEPTLIKVASAYESATHHRVPPPDFGPLPGEP